MSSAKHPDRGGPHHGRFQVHAEKVHPRREGGPGARGSLGEPPDARSKESLAQAVELIRAELSSGEWVSSNELHRKLGKQIPEGTFGRAKSALGIVHRRVCGDQGVRYEWRLDKG